MLYCQPQQLLSDTEDNLVSPSVAEREVVGDETEGGQSSQCEFSLDKQHVGAVPRRRQRRGDPGDAASRDQDARPVCHRGDQVFAYCHLAVMSVVVRSQFFCHCFFLFMPG